MRNRPAPLFALALVGAVAALAALAGLAAVAAAPAGATPSQNTTCTSCHGSTTSGTVTATPSTTMPSPGATYTVAIDIGLTAAGKTGYHVAQTDAAGTATTWLAVNSGTGSQSAWTATMTAPATPGAYYYKVWTAKGYSGMAKAVTYSITVPAPASAAAITSLNPTHAQTGAGVVITGSNLGASGSVKFGATTAATSAWSATSVTATVPASLAPGATTVTVTPTGGAASNGLAFTVDAAPAPTPVLTSLVPSTGIAGGTLVITGSNLGASGSVTVGGVAAATSAWGATSITCIVPAGLTAGARSVVVTPAGGQASNALTYTVTAAPVPVDSTDPVTTASGVPDVAWCNYPVSVSLAATDEASGSGVESVTYTVDGGDPVVVGGAAATVPLETSGIHTVAFFARDVAGNVEAAQSVIVNLDLSRPRPRAPRSATARRESTATLRYRIVDETPNAGTATVTIVVKNSRGRTVKRLELGSRPVNTALKATFACRLRPGEYRFRVSATDAAGNPQAAVASQRLRVLAR